MLIKKEEDILDQLAEVNEAALYPTDMASAIVGYVERCGLPPLALLDTEKCIKLLKKQGMSYEEAVEFFDYNTLGSYMGENTPCFATFFKKVK